MLHKIRLQSHARSNRVDRQVRWLVSMAAAAAASRGEAFGNQLKVLG